MQPYSLIGPSRFSSSGSRSFTRSNPFKIYATYGNAGTVLSEAVSGVQYYKNLGIGLAQSFYDYSGGSAYNQTNCENKIASDNSKDIWPYVDLYFLDSEGSYYAWTAAGAATAITDTTSVIGWARAKFATYDSDTRYLGCYGVDGGPTGIKTGASYIPWLYGPGTIAAYRADNDACGVSIEPLWDWLGPEMYANRMDLFAAKLDLYCDEYTRLGYTKPLIPFLQPTPSGVSISQQLMRAQLEYAYSREECYGVLLWNMFAPLPDAAPDYYNNQDWMIATLAFISAHNITLGTPF